jgi:transposase
MSPTHEPDADLHALRAENEQLRGQVQELLRTVGELRAALEKQQAHIDRLVRLSFGRSSERLDGPTLFDDCPAPEPAPPPTPPAAPPAVPGVPRRKGHGRKALPKDLPRERIESDLCDAEKDCPCCGRRRVRIGADVSERLDYRPACLFVREIMRPKYACPACEAAGRPTQVTQPPLPPEPLPRCVAAPGLLAQVLVSKYVDHLPLYRQEGIFERLGWEAARSTLCDLVLGCGNVLASLYELMSARVRQSFALHTDDTALTLLDPRRTAHAWVYVGDAANPYTVFDLSVGHEQEAPQAFLKGYQGFIHADGYAGYGALYAAGATHVGCLAHARRYFYDARLSDPERAHDALARIRTLYAIEAEAKERELDAERLAEHRRAHAGPVLASLGTWLAEQASRVLPKAPIAQAITYATNQWASLQVYLTDGRLTIDNHPAEQAIRPLAVGRRNWLHVGGDGGLRPTAVLLSLAASVKRQRINPWDYFRDVLTALPARPPGADLTDLLPDVWVKSRAGPAAAPG